MAAGSKMKRAKAASKLKLLREQGLVAWKGLSPAYVKKSDAILRKRCQERSRAYLAMTAFEELLRLEELRGIRLVGQAMYQRRNQKRKQS